MGGVQIWSYENGLIRAGRLGTLRERGSIHKCKRIERPSFSSRHSKFMASRPSFSKSQL
jgi:hypothetical protein